MISLLTPTFTAIAPARADEWVSSRILRGPSGTNAKANTFDPNTPATPGLPAPDISLIDGYTTLEQGKGPAVEIGSIGGKGGAGDAVLFSSEPGRAGGAGGAVSVVQNGLLRSRNSGDPANPSALLLVYSQGGDGGRAAHQVGAGGAGGAVTLQVSDRISANGDAYAAILARSIGGNAGGGGGTTAQLLSTSAGGAGGAVTVTIGSKAVVGASGANAPAVIAESIGGAGSVREGSTFSDPAVTNGGKGGDVTFVNRGLIVSDLRFSPAVLLQSVGGKGGEQPSGGGQPGGRGGAGGDVNATLGNRIFTFGDYGFGVVAQSIGGSGGRGGGGVFIGGDGGSAAPGGAVTVANFAQITTRNTSSIGIVAQSVGGGSATDAFQSAPITAGSASGGGGKGGNSFIIGGDGGNGGKGGAVTVSNGGTISTGGKGAYGILAQSIGGGGGAGGSVKGGALFFGFALGGQGGSGGDGGDVTITPAMATDDFVPISAPTITTRGEQASGIVALSVGGGGGSGGTATVRTAGFVGALSIAVGGNGGTGGNGGKVNVDNTSSIFTTGLQSMGIQAKSIGGGGGNAGSASAYALSVAGPDLPAVGVSFAMGGTGGDGGSGGAVTVVNSAGITTAGGAAPGIQAMSVGGGGGDGGVATSTVDMLGMYLNVGVAVALGGAAGGGGAGGDVSVTNYGRIQTGDAYSNGIQAVSVGGGGGEGGTATAAAASGLSWNDTVQLVAQTALPSGTTLSVNSALGGSGGKGGDGGTVNVVNSGTIVSGGNNSRGIFAQSVGGGGGNAGGYLASGEGTLAGKLSLGGSGGDGGYGGTVYAVNNGSIQTRGTGAVGILAQSVGGGGGTGGSFAGTSKSAPSPTDDTPKFIIQTTDELVKFDKLFVQFFGDKEKKDLADYGLLDKNAPIQKKVELAGNILKAIKILGDKDKDFLLRLAQAGGTGAVGFALQKLNEQIKAAYKDIATKSDVDLPKVDVTLTAGGSGGRGGDGGYVQVSNWGSVSTQGDNSYGLVGQSVGGGGGIGGSGVSTGTNKMNVNITLGATGGNGGAGGRVDAFNFGTITTSGAASIGLLAQSVGGGGGIGGASASANSISFSANVGLGGNSGTSSNGGDVNVTHGGTIATTGKQAHGIVAQSVGGGGGIVFIGRIDPYSSDVLASNQNEKDALDAIKGIVTGFGLGAGGTFGDNSATILPTPSVTAGIGGNGGAGGDGGIVKVQQDGAISTAGTAAFGIFAQSIGGGGGMGADANANGLNTLTANLGGKGGVGGNGGAVTVEFDRISSINTTGDGSHAVFAQSIGGGGGYSGLGTLQGSQGDGGFALVRNEVSSGNGGAITLKMGGDTDTMAISTTGVAAYGIYAQSVGAGGGTFTNMTAGGTVSSAPTPADGVSRTRAAGQGGTIDIDTRGSISATGLGSYGIFAQSGVQKTDGTLDASRLGGNITIFHDGTIIGGVGDGAAIRIDGGNTNVITVGRNGNVSALSDRAILASFGNDNLKNYGTIIGDVVLAGGGTRTNPDNANSFQNFGLYQTAGKGIVDLGPRGVLTNEGAFDIGGRSTFATATVTSGTFTLGGQLLVDVTSTPILGQTKSDLLQVKGATSPNFTGTIVANVVDGLRPETFTVASATSFPKGSPTAMGNPYAPFLWNASFSNFSVQISPSANFKAPPGFDPNPTQTNVMAYLQSVFNSGAISANGAQVFGAFARSSSFEDYMQGINSLAPDEAASVSTSQTLNTRASMHAALSCPVFEGSGTMMEETNCAWARIFGDWVHQTSSDDASGYNQNSVTYRVGAQREMMTDWFVGATAGITTSSLSGVDGMSSTDGTAFDAALSLKHQIGPWLLAVTGSFGYGNYQTDRVLNVGSDIGLSTGTANIFTGGGRFRASYEFAFSNWYMKPYADFDVLYTYMPGYTEQGTSLVNLQYSSAQQWNAAFSPNVEFGARYDINPLLWVRPYATVGATVFAKDNMPIDVRFTDSPISVPDFVTEVTIPDMLLNLSAGAQIFSTKGLELRVEYKVDVGDNYLAQEASARLAIPF